MTEDLLLSLAEKAKFENKYTRKCFKVDENGDVIINERTGKPEVEREVEIDLQNTLLLRKPHTRVKLELNTRDIKNFKEALFALVLTAAERALNKGGDPSKVRFEIGFTLSSDTVHPCREFNAQKRDYPDLGVTLRVFDGAQGIDTNITVTSDGSNLSSDPFIQNFASHFQWGQIALACGD